MASAARSKSLGLFRDILRAHQHLPTELRLLGNAYVREEFKKHKTAQPKFLTQFFAEWNLYLASMQEQIAAQQALSERQQDKKIFGRDLGSDELLAMNDEQKQQLQVLRKESLKVK